MQPGGAPASRGQALDHAPARGTRAHRLSATGCI